MIKEKNHLFITFVLLLILLGSILLTGCSNKMSEVKKNNKVSVSNIQFTDVDKIAENPGGYTGTIRIKGNVSEVITKNKIFTVACEDGDASLPVIYNGVLPKKGDNVEILGDVKKEMDGKYIFAAKEIKIDEK